MLIATSCLSDDWILTLHVRHQSQKDGSEPRARVYPFNGSTLAGGGGGGAMPTDTPPIILHGLVSGSRILQRLRRARRPTPSS
jgi:hypothetical protein